MCLQMQLHAEQRRGVRGGVHQQGGLPDAGGEAAEQGRRRLPHQHPVAEEFLAPGLIFDKSVPTGKVLLPRLASATARLISDHCVDKNLPVLTA